MRRPLLFATTNPGKLRELRALAGGLTVLSAEEVSPLPVVEETEATLEGNAQRKAFAWASASSLVTLADDSGLFVDALQGRPGVHSARYVEGSDMDRVRRLLEELREVQDGSRTASFRCALCLATPTGQSVTETGSCDGVVTREPAARAALAMTRCCSSPSLPGRLPNSQEVTKTTFPTVPGRSQECVPGWKPMRLAAGPSEPFHSIAIEGGWMLRRLR